MEAFYSGFMARIPNWTSAYRNELKRDAVYQITVRGYPVPEVFRAFRHRHPFSVQRMKLFDKPAPKAKSIEHEAENRLLKRELASVTEERDTLN